MIQINLFGTTTVVIDDLARVVAAPRQRAVLARLALTPGRSVSVDQLLDDVWSDDLSINGVEAVAFQIDELRRILEPDRAGAGTVIATDATESVRYRLTLDCEGIDVQRFERLVRDACVSFDDPDRAVHLIDDALGLWRARPFADIEKRRWVSDEISRLKQLRFLAVRTRIHCLLARGEHAEVVDELESLIRQHPFNEGLVVDYMIVLDAIGRTAGALRACGELRARLIEELGIEPSADVTALERRLLAAASPPATTAVRPDGQGRS